MSIPLYRVVSRDPPLRDSGGHAGLWFDKFCDKWRIVGSRWTMQSGQSQGNNPKLDWIRTVTGHRVGDSTQITEYVQRLQCLTAKRGGRAKEFEAESRFVTGLGRSHPVENGFAWHPTLGTPYLPGSSVKGMIRSWAATGADPRPDAEMWNRLLGEPGATGRICFLDAVPVVPVQLEADVMTPHYAGWDECNPPGDWRSPVPIPFLATAAGTRFLFGIIPCGDVAEDDLTSVLEWLQDALVWAGAGAKTAVGYGRFAVRASSGQTDSDVARNPGHDWVESKIEKLSAGPGVTPEQALRGKALAEAWFSIEDPSLKQAALDDIRARWAKKGWWDNPSGRTAKRVKGIYRSRDATGQRLHRP